MSMLAHANAIPAAQAEPSARALFIRRTYTHLALAIAAFAGIEYKLLSTPAFREPFLKWVSTNQYAWLMVLGAFVICGFLARGLATNVGSVPLQYLGLTVYIVVNAIIFVPLLYIAIEFSSPDVLPMAAILTGVMFAGLTLTVFTTRKDFSYLRGIISIGAMVALGLIVCSIVFGFTLGLVFSAVMIVLACAAILYDTSNILHHYPTNAHVAASLELFASVALLFWYVLRLLMSLSRD